MIFNRQVPCPNGLQKERADCHRQLPPWPSSRKGWDEGQVPRCGVDERLQLGIPRPYHHSQSNETSAFAYWNLWGSPLQSKLSATRALYAQSWSTPPLNRTPSRNTCRTSWRWSREKVQPYLHCHCPAGWTNSDSAPWNSVVLETRSPRCTCL